MDNNEKTTLRNFLSGVSAAINEVSGTTDPIQATQFASRIRGLSASGGSNILAGLITLEGSESVTIDTDTLTLVTRDTTQTISGDKYFSGSNEFGDTTTFSNGIDLSSPSILGYYGLTLNTSSNNPIYLFPNDYDGSGKVFYKGKEVATKEDLKIEIVDLTTL